jgi:hypothetical protein
MPIVTFERHRASALTVVLLLAGCSERPMPGSSAPLVSAGSSPAAGSGGMVGAAPAAGATSAPAAGRSGSAQPVAGASAGAGGASAPAPSSSGGAAGAAGSSGSSAGGPAAGSGGTAAAVERFSFFVTSYAAIQRLSGSVDGFGGDLRYGEADGLAGADKICSEIAESSLPGSGAKGWRAFLSVTKGPDGQPIHAIDRVGSGPWYDRVGRVVAMTRDDLLQTRPRGADPAIENDLPNEDGVPNHAPDGGEPVDNHDFLTGTNDQGQLYSADWGFTCHDWTSSVGPDGTPRVGHSWPRMGGGGPDGGGFPGGGGRPPGGGGRPPGGGGPPLADGGMNDWDTANWMSALTEAGCAPGASLVEMGPPDPEIPTVGSGGGYGGIYCLALTP